MEGKRILKTLQPYKPGKTVAEVQREHGLKHIVKLASNENPYGCSEAIKDVLQHSWELIHIYPDGAAVELKQELSRVYDISPDSFILGNGSDEVILMLSRALLEQGKNIVIADVTFPQYAHNALIEGAEVIRVPLVKGTHDLPAMSRAVTKDTKIIWVCNPNNPTGTYVDEDAFLSFMEDVSSDVLVVLDEAYFEYVTVERRFHIKKLLNKYDNLIVLRTFSKAYGLASLRVGYGISNPNFIRYIDPVREPFNTSTIAQTSAIAAIRDQDFIQSCYEKNKEVLQMVEQFCVENALSYYPTEGNFIMIDIGQDGNRAFEFLQRKGYIIRSGAALGLPTYIRMTLGTKEEMSGMLSVLKSILVEA